MSCDVARMGHIQCHVEQAKWSRILDVRAPALHQVPLLFLAASEVHALPGCSTQELCAGNVQCRGSII